jgi:hypothetical protein
LTTIYLTSNAIGAEGATALADALKVNASVSTTYIESNAIGAEGASALADALKVNTSVTRIFLHSNAISDKGASALADALKANTSVTTIDLRQNDIGAEGASALVDALKVNTSVTSIKLDMNDVDESVRAAANTLTARNLRFRRLLLFDARQMLLSRLCADEFGVLWSYFLTSSKSVEDGLAPDNIDSIRAELAAVVDERHRRELCRPVLVSDLQALQRQTNKEIATVNLTVAAQTSQIAEQTSQIAEQSVQQTRQIAEQTQQITVLNNNVQLLLQQVLEQGRQIRELLMTRGQEQSGAGVDEDDGRDVKRLRTRR